MEDNGVLHPLEIKKTTNPATELVGTFKLLYKASLPCGNGAIVCLRETLSAIDRINLISQAPMRPSGSVGRCPSWARQCAHP